MIRFFKRCTEIITFESSAKLVKEAGLYQLFKNKIEYEEIK